MMRHAREKRKRRYAFHGKKVCHQLRKKKKKRKRKQKKDKTKMTPPQNLPRFGEKRVMPGGREKKPWTGI